MEVWVAGVAGNKDGEGDRGERVGIPGVGIPGVGIPRVGA